MTWFARMGLGQRVALLGLLPLVVATAGVGTLVVRRTYEAMRAEGTLQLVEKTRASASDIETESRRIVTIPGVMANAETHGLFGRRAESLAYARSILEDYPEALGAYIAYEPDADGNDRASLGAGLPPGTLSPAGRFIPYYVRRNRSNPRELTLENLADMETSLYYRGVKNRFLMVPEMTGIDLPGGVSRHWRPPTPDETLRVRPMVTEPYDYQGIMLVEQTYPLVRGGQFVGIAGVDRSLDEMADRLKAILPYPDASAFLISGRGRIIATTQEAAFRLKTIESIAGWSTLLQQVYASAAPGGDAGTGVTIDPATGARLSYAAQRIPTGNWTLLIVAPESTILARATAVMWITVLGLLGIMAGLLMLVGGSARYVSSRVRRAATAADRVANRDLTVEIGDETRDAIGDTLRAVDRMVTSLREDVHGRRRFAADLTEIAGAISAAAAVQSATVTDFGATTNEVAAATREISATGTELARTVRLVAETVSETAKAAGTGKVGLTDLNDSMRVIGEATEAIAAKLGHIAGKAASIGSVVETITTVADQTNLLSLNAAIEANKAGEAGRGFGVVAREIRRLADQTAVATLDIESLIRDMQSSVSSGVAEMGRFSDNVRASIGMAQRIGEGFEQILDQVQSLRPRLASVDDGMQSQSVGTQSINQAMAQLSDAAQRTAASLTDLDAAAGSLRATVQVIEAALARFRV